MRKYFEIRHQSWYLKQIIKCHFSHYLKSSTHPIQKSGRQGPNTQVQIFYDQRYVLFTSDTIVDHVCSCAFDSLLSYTLHIAYPHQSRLDRGAANVNTKRILARGSCFIRHWPNDLSPSEILNRCKSKPSININQHSWLAVKKMGTVWSARFPRMQIWRTSWRQRWLMCL